MIKYSDFCNVILKKLKQNGGKATIQMLKKNKTMNIWLADDKSGILNSNFELNCEFKILYAILNKAKSLGGEMYRGDSGAQGGATIGSEKLSLDTIDGYISTEFYGKKIGEKTTRRSTYYAAILDWAGFVQNNYGGYIEVNREYMK